MRNIIDADFANVVKQWLSEDGEVYAILWYYRCGGLRNYAIVSWWPQLEMLVDEIQVGLRVELIVYRHPNFPLRGTANQELLEKATAMFPDGTEWWLMCPSDDPPHMCYSWGDSTTALLAEEIRKYWGRHVLIGPDTQFPTGNETNDILVSSAIHPQE